MNLPRLYRNLKYWYLQKRRNLPWRVTNDPYKIWVSEIILQQTRVEQGLPYYQRFLERFPTLKSLAESQERDILVVWQGLGYYSRARNMLKCAKMVSRDFGGVFPNDYSSLLKLPGIGPYTAAAIGSFAFDLPEAAIDGNALRVYTRLLGIYEDIAKQSTQRLIREKANKLISDSDPGTFNQAIMELGSRVCLPSKPKCPECPFHTFCYANEHSEQVSLPVKVKKQKIRTRYFNYFLIERDGLIAMSERKNSGIWKGLFEFYLIESEKQNLTVDSIDDPIVNFLIRSPNEVDIIENEVKHVLSHQNIYARFFHVKLAPVHIMEPAEIESLHFYSENEILDLPKPVLINNFLKLFWKRQQEITITKDN